MTRFPRLDLANDPRFPTHDEFASANQHPEHFAWCTICRAYLASRIDVLTPRILAAAFEKAIAPLLQAQIFHSGVHARHLAGGCLRPGRCHRPGCDHFDLEDPDDALSRDDAIAALAGVHGIPVEHFNTDPDVLRSSWRWARRLTDPDRDGGDQAAWDRVERAARALGLVQP